MSCGAAPVGWSSRHKSVGGSHNLQSFLISYKANPLHANMACTITLEVLCDSIISAFGRLLSVYQTQRSCTSDWLFLVHSFPGMKDGRYWQVLSRDTALEYKLHQLFIWQYEKVPWMRGRNEWERLLLCWWRRTHIGVSSSFIVKSNGWVISIGVDIHLQSLVS